MSCQQRGHVQEGGTTGLSENQNYLWTCSAEDGKDVFFSHTAGGTQLVGLRSYEIESRVH